MLKRLQRYQTGKNVGVIALEKDGFDIFKQKYKVQIEEEGTVAFYQGKIVMRVDFADTDMEKVVNKLNGRSGE